MIEQAQIEYNKRMKKRTLRTQKSKKAFVMVVKLYKRERQPRQPCCQRGGNQRNHELFLGRECK
jgi:hypothetical protein